MCERERINAVVAECREGLQRAAIQARAQELRHFVEHCEPFVNVLASRTVERLAWKL